MTRIMIIDDDPALQQAIRLVFPLNDYNLEIHADGQILFSETYEKPDIFLLDKQLNGVDGLDLCRFLKTNETTKAIPVIILSASPYVRGAALAAGADEMVEKPFSISSIRQLVSALTRH